MKSERGVSHCFWENKQKELMFQAAYDYYIEYVAIQFRRLTKVLLMALLSTLCFIWYLNVIGAVFAAGIMVIFCVSVLLLSESFLWRNNDIVYRIYMRRLSSYTLHPHRDRKQLKIENDLTSSYDVGYPMLYHRFSYILACKSNGLKTQGSTKVAELNCYQRWLYNFLF